MPEADFKALLGTLGVGIFDHMTEEDLAQDVMNAAWAMRRSRG